MTRWILLSLGARTDAELILLANEARHDGRNALANLALRVLSERAS